MDPRLMCPGNACVRQECHVRFSAVTNRVSISSSRRPRLRPVARERASTAAVPASLGEVQGRDAAHSCPNQAPSYVLLPRE